GGGAARTGPGAVVSVDQRADCERGGRLAHHLCLCEALADRDELALRQERAGHGESAPVDVGAAPQTAAPRDPGLCLSAFLAASRTDRGASLVAPLLVSPHRKAEPHGRDSALSAPLRAQPALAR